MKTPMILVVDDDPFIRSEIVSLIDLEFSNIEVMETESAESSFKVCEQSNFDLVISDINLPGLSGLDLIAKLYEPNPQLEFLIITGKSSILEDYELQLMEKVPPDRVAFLRKPFENDELYFLIAKSLKKVEIAKKNIELLVNIKELAETGEQVHGIAHDLKGFLTGIQLLAGDGIKFILENMDVNSQKGNLIHSCDEIVESTETALQFIEALLAPQRSDREVRSMEIGELVKKSIMPLSYYMRERKISFTFLPLTTKLYVQGNDQLIRVLMNLIKNSIEATETQSKGVIKIHIEEKRENVEVIITDNGNGIAKNILEKLNLGIQVTTKKEVGNGLGISGAHRILATLNGCLKVVSTQGKGATFRVILNKKTRADYENTDS